MWVDEVVIVTISNFFPLFATFLGGHPNYLYLFKKDPTFSHFFGFSGVEGQS